MSFNKNRIRIELSLILRNVPHLKKFISHVLHAKLISGRFRNDNKIQNCSKIHAAKEVLNVPRVTVILPTYNHGRYLDLAIQSVLLQSGIDLQLIVINDGSTDNSDDVLEAYLGHPRITIVNQENKGLPSAINAGLGLADGDLITWTSADNKYLPGALNLLACALIENKDATLVYGDYQLIDEFGFPLTNSTYRVLDQDILDTSKIRTCRTKSLLNCMPDNYVGPLFMFRREQSTVVGHFSNLIGVEDYDYWLRLNCLGEVRHAYSEGVLYQYRIHTNTLSNKSRELKTRKKLRDVVSTYW
jgi:glycosyltransferase involved in cell wall biosynthesis